MGLFADETDYQTFVRLVDQTRNRVPMRICAYCIMPNHWHLALWPEQDNTLPAFLHLLTSEHVRVWRKRWDVSGHVYQGRYRCFVVAKDDYYQKVIGYIESNASRAKLVPRAADWKWTSAHQRVHTNDMSYPVLVDAGPLSLPNNWAEFVDAPLSANDLEKLRKSFSRGKPFGSDEWAEAVAKELKISQVTRPTRGDQTEGE